LTAKPTSRCKIIAINKFHDLALLQIEDKNAPKFKFITLGSADALTVGDPVFAIGSPLGLERTVTQGIISTKTRELEGELYLQTTAQINPGNSGGPLFNMAGEVVGVTNMKITFGEGLGFAIPVELVKNFLDHRDAFAYSTDNPNNPYRYLEPPSRTNQKPPAGKIISGRIVMDGRKGSGLIHESSRASSAENPMKNYWLFCFH
jgi:serine protease Do